MTVGESEGGRGRTMRREIGSKCAEEKKKTIILIVMESWSYVCCIAHCGVDVGVFAVGVFAVGTNKSPFQ